MSMATEIIAEISNREETEAIGANPEGNLEATEVREDRTKVVEEGTPTKEVVEEVLIHQVLQLLQVTLTISSKTKVLSRTTTRIVSSTAPSVERTVILLTHATREDQIKKMQ